MAYTGGLSLGAGAQVRAGSQVRYGATPQPDTISEAAYGPAMGTNGDGKDGLLGFLIPNDEAGLLFWRGVLATGLLILMYKSL